LTRTCVGDCGSAPWRRGESEGITFAFQSLLAGDDGGPEAIRFRFDPCPSVYAHMHLTAQFQVLLAGRMDMPRGRMELRPPAVHYTDHNVPYGPFAVDDGHDMLVLHPRQAGLVPMADPTARRRINLRGRLLEASAHAVEWSEGGPSGAVRSKTLLPAALGPEAVLAELPPGAPVSLGPPLHGRYEVVLAGRAVLGERALARPSFRYAEGEEPAEPLLAGPEGLTVLLLTFDSDALEGGLRGDEMSRQAAETLARAL
jgi:hypothetical protein